MSETSKKYVATIGLEVHIQLSTKSKAYSSDSAAYGGSPNSYVSPITLGHPGHNQQSFIQHITKYQRYHRAILL